MATVGTIEQYQGPFTVDQTLNLDNSCIIGISIGEDDYMKLGSPAGDRSFRFTINGQQIWMGRTYIYQTGNPIITAGSEGKVTVIGFPDGSPPSVLVEVVHCSSQQRS